MKTDKNLALSLFALRVTVALVMLVWNLEKFINPQHAAKVFESFYRLGGLGSGVMYAIGAVEMIIVAAFLGGFMKRYSYGMVLALHAISTFSSYKQYLAPFEGPNILFFAAWPMLAACLALYLLRDRDIMLTVDS
ncbi:MAG: hypothetical protein KKB30_06270 [Proteobacteria bacterium]|nr:hypothetical protein [Pseudomonadota bacterium]MBU1715126.1 hypothetical protein [Pseudomonadota bacterium]